jgi:prepilin-type N-terminal cleavage/methylation domain-containing protein
MKRLLAKKEGFSLIELMIVVAIIGILAAVAVPNYQKFTRKAKQAEGKSLLSGYYTAAKATMAEHGVHNGNFVVVGFKPEGELLYRITVDDSGVGLPATFAAVQTRPACDDTVADGNGGVGTACAGEANYVQWVNHPVTAQQTVAWAAPNATQTTWTAHANANLLGVTPAAAATEDRWQINQNKMLAIVQDGTE